MLDLEKYIEENIIIKYNQFDESHGIFHVREVIKESLNISKYFDVNKEMVYTIAAYHDVGLEKGRELHHKYSAEFLLKDNKLRDFFSESDIILMAEAVEDHRASSLHEPRSLYGKIIADADRTLEPKTIIKRAIQFSQSNFPKEDKELIYSKVKEHLNEKYAVNGYLKLWLNVGEISQQFEKLQKIIADEILLRKIFEDFYCL